MKLPIRFPQHQEILDNWTIQWFHNTGLVDVHRHDIDPSIYQKLFICVESYGFESILNYQYNSKQVEASWVTPTMYPQWSNINCDGDSTLSDSKKNECQQTLTTLVMYDVVANFTSTCHGSYLWKGSPQSRFCWIKSSSSLSNSTTETDIQGNWAS